MMNAIPSGFQTRFFRETEGDAIPTILNNGATIEIPCFIREVQREDGTTGYKWIPATIPNNGQNTSDYDTCVQKSWSSLRKFFYGAADIQNEMRDDSTWEQHRQSVRSAFPKYEGEINAAVVRYDDIKKEFWDKIDAVLASVQKTRDKLPAMPFIDKDMFVWADQNKVPEDVIKSAEEVFVRVAINLGTIKRSWNELFIDIPA